MPFEKNEDANFGHITRVAFLIISKIKFNVIDNKKKEKRGGGRRRKRSATRKLDLTHATSLHRGASLRTTL